MATTDYREQLTQRVIQAIEAGTAPWMKPWNGEVGAYLLQPRSAVSGNEYRGMNAISLMMAGYDDPRWCTYNQAKERGWQVRKGEKGTPIEYWKFHDVKKEKDPATGQDVEVRVELKPPRVFFATVFNLSQMDNAPLLEKGAPEWDAHLLGDAVIASCGVRIFHDETDRAYYMPGRDEIHAPPRAAFPSAGQYYATMFHEIGHSTGHQSRLGREFGKSFGSPEYSLEELRAEMASLFISTKLGIPHSFENHASYVGGWLKKLREDKNEIFRAARDAEQIADYVLDLGRGIQVQIAENGLLAVLPQAGRVSVENSLGTGATLSWAEPAGHFVGPVLWADGSFMVQSVNGRGVIHRIDNFAPGAFDDDGHDRSYKWNGLNALIQYGEYGANIAPASLMREEALPPAGLLNAQKDALEAETQTPHPQAQKGKGPSKRHLPLEERMYLFVPYQDRAIAAERGALFDDRHRAYIGVDWNTDAFSAWLSPPPMLTKRQIIDAFVKQCEQLKLNMDDEDTSELAIMDGQWHKTTVTSSKNHKKKSGAYLLNHRGYGCIANHDTGEIVRFEREGRLVDEQQSIEAIEQHRRNMEAARKAQQDKIENVARSARRDYAGMEASEAVVGSHIYLERKCVPAFPGVRSYKNAVVIPMSNAADEIRNLQYIDPEGNKRFRKEGEKKGNFFAMGDIDTADVVLFGEGYATMATAHLATRFTSIQCFDAGNIEAVMGALAERTQNVDKIILCDNDLVTPTRVARTLNNENARAKHGYPKVPVVAVEEALAKGANVMLGADGRFALTAVEAREVEHYEVPRIYAQIIDCETGEVMHKVTISNVGMEKALAAAEKHGAKVVAPLFSDPNAYEYGYKDFNDLQCQEGVGRVQQELAAVVDLVKGRRTVEMFAKEQNYNLIEFVEPADSGRYTGRIVGNAGAHSVQEVGRAEAVAHPVSALDWVPIPGEVVRIQYAGGRATVDTGRPQTHGQQR